MLCLKFVVQLGASLNDSIGSGPEMHDMFTISSNLETTENCRVN